MSCDYPRTWQSNHPELPGEYVDKDLVMQLDGVPVGGDATYASLFSRGMGDTQFENFKVTGLERIKNKEKKDR